MQRLLFTYGKALLFEFLNMKNYNRMFHVKHFENNKLFNNNAYNRNKALC